MNNPPLIVQPSVTFYTTFTYWTTSIDGDNTIITSREETKTDIIAATITDEILPTSIGIGIDATEGPEKALWQTTNNDDAYETALPDLEGLNLEEIDVLEATTETAPELESGEVDTTTTSGPISISVTPSLTSSLSSSELVQTGNSESSGSSSSVATPNEASAVADFNDLDDDFILSSSSAAVQEENESVGVASQASSLTPSLSSTASPASRGISSRSKLTFTRPSSGSFTPVIRPNLFRTRIRPNNRPRNRASKSTTVAIITRSDVTPTLIATPVSSQLQTSSPNFESSSRVRNLSSASLLSRGQISASVSGAPVASSAPASAILASSASINPTRASSSATSFESSSDIEQIPQTQPSAPKTIGINENTELEPENTPVILSGVRLRRPDPFKARLKERQRQRLAQLRQNSAIAQGPPSSPRGPPSGARTPIFLGSRSENIRRDRQKKVELTKKPFKPESVVKKEVGSGGRISLPPAIASQRDRARQRINALFRRRQPSFLRPKPSALLGQDDQDPLQVEASQLSRRRKRQVSNFTK